MKFTLVVLTLLSFNLYADADKVKVPQPAVEQGESWNQKDVENTDFVLDSFRKKLVKDTGNNPHMNRDAHPKHHGCVKTKLTIDNSKLDAKLRVGLFQKNATYDSLIRFSNGDPNPKKEDIKGDVRGFSFKILGVPYQNYLAKVGVEAESKAHDMVFMNSSTFFVKNSKMYARLMPAFQKGGLALAWFAITHPRAVMILIKASTMKVYNPLDIDYHSATPYKLGPTSMKMKFASCKTKKDTKPSNPSADYLGERLASHLAKQGTCFDFYVQPNRDTKRNDVENPMKDWSTKKSPFIKVGRVNVPKQTGIRSEKRQEFCENASFNPWRAPEENRPMGAVNRTRLEVYVKQAKFRHAHNNVNDPLPSDANDVP